MRYYLSILFFFFLLLCIQGEKTSAYESEESEEPEQFLLDRPVFSTDVDYYLGQYKRRRGAGGRVWSNLYYADTTIKPKDENRKINPNVFGLQVGFDVIQAHGVYSTFWTNINQNDAKLGGGSDSKIENYLFGYGKFVYLNGCHFGFSGAAGYDRYKVKISDLAQLKGDGLQANLFGEFGVDLILGQWGIKPFYALQYDYLYHGRIGEKETMNISDWNGHGLSQLFGLRLNWKVIEALELQSRMAWVHEYLNDPPPFYHGHFSAVQGTTTPAIMFYEGNTGRDWAWLGLGLKTEGVYNVFLFLDYDLMINEQHTTHLVNLGLCFGW